MNTQKQAKTQAVTQFELSKDVLHNLYKYNITPTTKLVLLYLVDCFNPDNNKTVYPKIETIAQTLGFSLRAVKQSINQLIKQGIILKTKKYNRNQYIFTSKIAPSKVKNLHLQGANFAPSYIEQIKEQKNQQREDKKISDTDLQILKNHIQTKKDIKHPVQYLNKVLSGDYKPLLNELKQARNNNLYMLRSTQETIKNLQKAKIEAVAPNQKIKDTIARIKAMV